MTVVAPALVEDWPVWRTHMDYDDTVDCIGVLQWDDQEGDVWSVRCSGCVLRLGFPRAKVDPETRVARLLHISRLPDRFLEKQLDSTTDNWAGVQAIQHLIDRWAEAEKPRPPMLVGEPGRGKTHMLVRAARRLIVDHHVHLRYCTFSDLMDEAKRAMDAHGQSATEIFDDAARVPLLVLDDLGAGLGSDWSLNMLEALVDRRYRDLLPVMGATNVPRGRWPDVFGARVGSRLLELCEPVVVGGPDRRLG